MLRNWLKKRKGEINVTKKKHTEEHDETHTEVTVAPAEEGGFEQDPIKRLEADLAAKETEAAVNWDKFLRERADLENLRKRFQKEKEDLFKYGNENLIQEILPSVDNLERALEHATADNCASAISEGVKMTLNMLLASLKKFGVTPIEAKGATFDPAFHQAMAQVEDSGQEPNTVVQEFQKGYMLNDRLLRPAMVTVATAPKA